MGIEITNNDLGGIEIQDGVFRDEILTFPATDIYARGTLLARRKVATAIATSPDVGNTGDGTVTAAAAVGGPQVPLVGGYVLTCTAAVTNGGVFKLEDPNGGLVANELTMTPGASAATVFEVGGMTFTITDGAADFAVDDFFTLTVAADGTIVVFDPAGVGGEQLPHSVLTYEVTRTGAGTKAIRALVGGLVNETRLIIDVDGDGSNITAEILDQLRAAGVDAVPVQQLSQVDNPQP